MNELYSAPSGGTLATMGLLANGKFPTISSSDDPFRKTYDGTMTPPTIDKVPLSIFSVITPWDDQTDKQQKQKRQRKQYGSIFLMASINYEVVGWSDSLFNRKLLLSYCDYVIKPNFVSAFVNIMTLVLLFTSFTNPITIIHIYKLFIAETRSRTDRT